MESANVCLEQAGNGASPRYQVRGALHSAPSAFYACFLHHDDALTMRQWHGLCYAFHHCRRLSPDNTMWLNANATAVKMNVNC